MNRPSPHPGPGPPSKAVRGRSRWRLIGVVFGLGVGLIAFGIVHQRGRWRQHHLQEELKAARRERESGRTATAAQRLAALDRAFPDRGDVLYELGLCEALRGRHEAAAAAWDRIPNESPESLRAGLQRASIAIAQGRFRQAESLLREALRNGPSGAKAARSALRDSLVRLLRSEGRNDEARRIDLEGLEDAADPVAFLRRLDQLDTEPFASEGLPIYLESAGRQAPNDDRVWLGRANLALRLGQLDEADQWLSRCLERQPNDPAVWRARLEFARIAGRPELAASCLRHLPADPVLAAETQAWLARLASDPAGEEKALKRLLDIDGGNAPALARLAELAIQAGNETLAEQYRTSKSTLDRASDRYRALLAGPDPARHAGELAELAEVRGKAFEAALWRSLTDPRQPRPTLKPAPPGTLADLVTLPANLREVEPRSIASGPARVQFIDEAEAAGLSFIQDNGDPGRRMIPPVTFCGGVAVLDYDGDDRLDVYVVQGGRFPPDPDRPRPNADRLFRNKGDGTFEDVTERSGIARFPGGYGHGVTVGDYDNDGRPDLFVTRWRSYALYHNRGDGTFEDVTEPSGLGGDRDWPTSSAFADLDNDGDLDLYVCHYLRWDPDSRVACVDPDDPSVYHCMPRDFPALPDHVFRNDSGRFVDVTRESGFTDPDGRGLGVVAADLDGDGRIDLFVANDTTANYLFHNKGGFEFEEIGVLAGVAANSSGGFQAGMGVACGDLDGDGRLDLAVTNFHAESTSYFQNLGGGFFAERSARIGLAAPSRFLLGFGIAFLDANNDGRLDVITANGHVFDGRPQYPWRMPLQLLLGGPDGRVHDVSEQSGDPFLVLRLGRGLALGDLDNDGRTDVLVVDQNAPLAYLRNRSAIAPGLTLMLEGGPSNRDAVGAIATVTVGGRRQVSPRLGGGSYQSASEPWLRFGLGESAAAEEIEIRWPSGRRERFGGRPAGFHRLREGSGRAISP